MSETEVTVAVSFALYIAQYTHVKEAVNLYLYIYNFT